MFFGILCILGCCVFLILRIRELEKAIKIAEENIRSLNKELGKVRVTTQYIYQAINNEIKDNVERI